MNNYYNWNDSYDRYEKAIERVTGTLKTARTICLVLVILAAVAAALIIAKKIMDIFNKNHKLPIRNVKETVLAGIALITMVLMLIIPTANVVTFDYDILDYISSYVDEDITQFSGWSITFGDNDFLDTVVGLMVDTEITGFMVALLIFIMLVSTLIICLAILGIATIVIKYFETDKPVVSAGKKLTSRYLGFGIFYFVICLILYAMLASEMEGYILLSGYISPILAIAIKIGYSFCNNLIPDDLYIIKPQKDEANDEITSDANTENNISENTNNNGNDVFRF